MKNRYKILRRIILAFRSHSKGTLAKLKVKIESREFIKGEEGRLIYEKLLNNQVLYSEAHMLFINADKLHEHLGINYHDLKASKVTHKIREFIKDSNN